MALLSPKPDRVRKLESGKSLAILRSAESIAVVRGPQTSVETSSGDCGDGAIVLQISIHRDRVALMSVLTVAVVVTLMVVFGHEGVVVDHFYKKDLNATHQHALVEKYNSYSVPSQLRSSGLSACLWASWSTSWCCAW